MKILVEAYGCTLNHGESEEFIEAVVENGHEIISIESEADAFVLFTCGVIETTEKHMLKRIGQLAETEKKLIVCGCLGNINPQGILKIAHHAQLFGPGEHMLATDLFSKDPGKGKRESNPQPKIGILPIATGCLGNCSYCITKVARGSLQSRPVNEIKQRLEMLVARDCVEIQICAQDTAAYGLDFGSNIQELVRELEKVQGNFMMRIGMMNPANANKNLSEIIGALESPKVFKFVHLPVQSGADSILGAMNRKHTVQDYLGIVDALRSKFSDISISTDIIIGFPGESEDDFQNSIEAMRRTVPDIINITKFSSRPGTSAHSMKNRVPGLAIKERSKIMTDLRLELTGQVYGALVGKRKKALATECLVEGSTFLRTENYRPVLVQENLELGKWYDVEITGVERVYMTGKVC